MTSRNILWTALRIVAGACALFVTLRGLFNLHGIELRIDTIVSVLYCLLPFLSFFVFFFVKARRTEVVLHAVIAFGYLAVYSMLNWRTCSSFGYCDTFASTVFTTFRTKQILAAFAVLILSLIALLIGKRTAAESGSY